MNGKLILVVSPAGGGKSTLLKYLREQMPEVVFPISCTTRPMRPGEVEGAVYHFISDEEFQRRAANEEFLEWVYTDGKRYGTLKSQIMSALEQGKTVVREIDIKGFYKIQAIIPKEVLRAIYIDAGTWEDLEKRILARAPIEQTELASRRARFEEEAPFKAHADVVVANPDGGLEQAKQDFIAAVKTLSRS
jgi:guanylate kinase